MALNVASASPPARSVIVQDGAEPLHAPDQLARAAPAAGVAVSLTLAPAGPVMVQVAPMQDTG